jgi:hypothetical protein
MLGPPATETDLLEITSFFCAGCAKGENAASVRLMLPRSGLACEILFV